MKVGILIVIALTLALSYCSYSREQTRKLINIVDVFSIKSAVKVREHVINHKACPKYIEGWNKAKDYGNYQLEIRVGNENGKLPVFFKCNDELEYNFIVKYSMDSGIYLSGNNDSDIELTYGHFTDHKKLYIGNNPDIQNVVSKIHNY